MIWYQDYGWAQSSDTLDVTAATTYTASNVQSSYLGGKFVVTGSDISPCSVIRVGGFEGKIIEQDSSTATF